MYTDTDRINQLDTNPNEAMEALVAEYTALVWHIASKYLVNAEDVRECVNETFSEVYIHRREFDETKGNLAVWIGTIGKHRAISMYRKLKKKGSALDCVYPDMENLTDAENPVEAAEDAIDIEEAMKKLSETDRQMIRMKYYEGMSISEIAESLHIPYDTARKRHKRSVLNLKKLLILTLAILALLALVACGIILAYRHFRVLPGYGITTEEDSASFILPKPVTVQQDIFTIEIVDAAVYGNKLRYEYTVTMPMHEEYLTEEGDWKFEYAFYGGGCIRRYADGKKMGIQLFEGKTKHDYNENGLFSENQSYTLTLKESECKRIKGKDSLELVMNFDNMKYGGVEYGDMEVPFTLVRTTADELGEYAHLYDGEHGGIMADSVLDGDTLSLRVYPLAGSKYEYYARLTEDLRQDIENDAPVTIVDEAGKVYTAEPSEFYWSFGQEDMVTYTFKGITPGTYTLSLPYVYLLHKVENLESLRVNLDKSTFDSKPAEIPGGTVTVKSVCEIEPEPIEKELDLYERKWKITLHCERAADELHKIVQIPFDLTPEWTFLGEIRSTIRGHAVGGGTGGILTLDEETGDASFILGLSKEALKDRKIKNAEIKLSEHPDVCVFRYHKPVELKFEVRE